MSPIQFVVFMDSISRRCRAEEAVWFGNRRVLLLLVTDDAVLLASPPV